MSGKRKEKLSVDNLISKVMTTRIYINEKSANV